MDAAPPADPSSWASSEATRRTMLGNRSSDTHPELALRRALRAAGLTGYRLRWPVPGAPRRSVDVAFVGRRVAVMVDGYFWHGCPEHGTAPRRNGGYWGPKIQRNRERDADTDRLLREHSWAVVRLWEHETVEDAVAAVVDELAASALGR